MIVTDQTALYSGRSWVTSDGTAPAGRGAFITFSFPAFRPAHVAAAHGGGAWLPFSEAEKAHARAALQQWADASGLVFLEVGGGRGQIQFSWLDFSEIGESDDTLAFAYYPWWTSGLGQAGSIPTGFTQTSGDVFFNSDRRANYFNDTTKLGATLIHEIGHALGLKHPFSGEVRLAAHLDTWSQTVMSYRGERVPVLGPLDRKAIADLYGGPGSDGAHLSDWSWNAAQEILTQVGTDGADVILGTSIRDVIEGGAGADLLAGLEGDDTFVGGAGVDTLEGGDGFDTLSYAAATAGVIASLDRDQGAEDIASSIEHLLGSAFDDRLTGGRLASTITGGAGADTIVGGSGLTTASYASSGAGVRVLLHVGLGQGGDAEGDVLQGVKGIIGSNHADWFESGYDADALKGRGGADTVSYGHSGSGVTVDLASTGAQKSEGSAKGDILVDIENLVGSQTNDRLAGSLQANAIDGAGGEDLINGRQGNDSLSGGAGADTLEGGSGVDAASYETSAAGVSVDLGLTVQAGSGDEQGDVLSGIESLIGSAFADRLTGSAKANTIEGGAGADTLDGAGGFDTISYAKSEAGVTIHLQNDVSQGGDAEGDVLSNIEIVIGSAHDDLFRAATPPTASREARGATR